MKKLTTFVFFLLSSFYLFAQWPEEKTINTQSQFPKEEKTKKFDASKLIYGGGFGLTFGSLTAIELSPFIGYKILPKFHMGIGAYYTFLSFNKHNIHTYGGSLFARYYVFGPLFLHAEFQGINDELYPTKERIWFGYPLAGVGIRQPIGNRSAIVLLLLWNFNENSYNVNNPIIQVGFGVGI